jgi:hypothetical protein
MRRFCAQALFFLKATRTQQDKEINKRLSNAQPRGARKETHHGSPECALTERSARKLGSATEVTPGRTA